MLLKKKKILFEFTTVAYNKKLSFAIINTQSNIK